MTLGCGLTLWRRVFGLRLPRWLPRWLDVAPLIRRCRRHRGPFRRAPHEILLVGWGCAFAASTAAHTMASHSRLWSTRLFSMDRSLVALGVVSSTVASGLLHFPAQTAARHRFVAAAVVCGVIASLAVAQPDNVDDSGAIDKRRWLTVLALTCQSVLSLIPVLRELVTTRDARIKQLVYRYATASCTCSLIGAVLYGAKLPEKCK